MPEADAENPAPQLPPLPVPRTTVSTYLRNVVHDGIKYISGQLPYVDGALPVTGTVGRDVSVEQAEEAARICALNALGVLDAELGGLAHVGQVLRVTGYVACEAGFDAQPRVIDAASKVFLQYLGERGRHARSAVGVASLPRNAPVEIEVTVAIIE
ncbi:MAG: hypothetical protein QOH52_2046 [Pseudonocardiales bacterium]|nr:hypothetical protein [Pseudonocardiales bacterium]